MTKPIKGVDVSENNGKIKLSDIKKAGYDFVMIRCGYGSNIKTQDDKLFSYFVKQAEKINMPWGVYIYSYAVNKSEVESEIAHVKRILGEKKPPMGVAFDMEDADSYKSRRKAVRKELISEMCEYFLSEMSKEYSVMLYTSLFWLGNLISERVYKKYPLWLAQWNTVCSYKGNNLIMWQYGGEQNFISDPVIPNCGVVDQNFYYGGVSINNKKQSKKKSNDVVAKEVLAGKWSNGEERKKKLKNAGYDYNAIQKIVNFYLIANEVIVGKYGNGDDRKRNLKNAGYDYATIQKYVNKILKNKE